MIKYSPQDLIHVAKKQGYDVLAITEHGETYFPQSIRKEAANSGILLLPGIEAYLGSERDHVLVINTDKYPAKSIKDIKDFRIWAENDCDRGNTLIGAPHPYYYDKCCIGDKLEENIDLFDFIEYSFFRSFFLPTDPNEPALEIAEKYNKPILGTGDIHRLWQFGSTYSVVKAKKNPYDVVSVIKNSGFGDCCIEEHFKNENNLEKNITTKTRRLTAMEFAGIMKEVIIGKFSRNFKKS
ncbi:MAG: hypothetical protein KAS04_05755 [Candidatus Aenigmarchaeota archaeon]|nr:hypothetical protein [Candidatus Aenigmarchaeota archaeon]